MAAEVIEDSERQRKVPAARCRGCGVVTWAMNLYIGALRTGAEHGEGCTEPHGRLDLKSCVPLAQQPERWQLPMTDTQMNEAEQKWMTHAHAG